MMLITDVLHNNPNRGSDFNVIGAGLVMFVSMMLISYAMYVYAMVLQSPHEMFIQVTTT